jgi:hypothetical protein
MNNWKQMFAKLAEQKRLRVSTRRKKTTILFGLVIFTKKRV